MGCSITNSRSKQPDIRKHTSGSFQIKNRFLRCKGIKLLYKQIETYDFDKIAIKNETW